MDPASSTPFTDAATDPATDPSADSAGASTGRQRPTVLLDCDPGLDDAVAIALALDHADVAAITTVGGNVGIELTTANALGLTELLGRADVPVHAGHDDPFAAAPVQRAAQVHGSNGMGDAELPTPSRPATSDDAVGAIVEATHRHPGLWIVATGPLTNVAHAVTADPSLVERVAGLSWMGGSSRYGNVTAVAEFNAWADPEAVAVVLDAGFPTLCQLGLNVTHTVLLDAAWIERLAVATEGTSTAVFVEILRFYLSRQRTVSVLDGAAVHDALAVLRVTHPEHFAGTPRHVEMILEGPARGMTMVDERPRPSDGNEQVEVVTHADAAALRSMIWNTLTG